MKKNQPGSFGHAGPAGLLLRQAQPTSAAQPLRGPSGCTLQFLRLAQEISAAIPHAGNACISLEKLLSFIVFSLSNCKSAGIPFGH
jgi:hypothetical protein